MKVRRDYPITVYWLGGGREIMLAKSATYDGSDLSLQDIADAFNRRGYGGSASAGVDWYSRTADDTHYFVQGRGWVKRENKVLTTQEFNAISDEDLEDLLVKGNVAVDTPEKHRMWISPREYGCFGTFGWTRYAEVTFGEYCVGEYGQDPEDWEEGAHHYMGCGGSYFNANDFDSLIRYARLSVKGDQLETKVTADFTCRLEDLVVDIEYLT